MSATRGCLHQLASAHALAQFAAAGPWPAGDAFLLIEDAVTAWPALMPSTPLAHGHVLATDLALSGLPLAAFSGLLVVEDADWPGLLTCHRRVLSWP